MASAPRHFFFGTEEGVDFAGDGDADDNGDGDLPSRVGSPQVHVASVLSSGDRWFVFVIARPWSPVGLQSVALHHGFELLD